MNEVKNWLFEFGEEWYWVGGRDVDEVDDIIWVEQAEYIAALLWGVGEPIHPNGDCVYLDINR